MAARKPVTAGEGFLGVASPSKVIIMLQTYAQIATTKTVALIPTTSPVSCRRRRRKRSTYKISISGVLPLGEDDVDLEQDADGVFGERDRDLPSDDDDEDDDVFT